MEENGIERAIFTADFQAAVQAELDSMLKAAIFTQSNRCKRFLRYVVLQTLSGKADELKERSIGISIFDRTSDYDTGGDSIVRVTANEVRKRLAQFYGESGSGHSIQIELPRGSYVPEFRVHAAHRDKNAKTVVPGLLDGSRESTEITSNGYPEISDSTTAPPATSIVTPSSAKFPRKRLLVATVVVLVLAGTAVFGLWRRALNRGLDIWSSFQSSGVSVLVCIDTHRLSPDSSTEPQTFGYTVLRKQIIALDDAAVLSSMASMLGRKGINFRVMGAEQVSLTEFRRQPVILIGAIDNKWTIRLTQNLRYRIEVENPPNSGTEKAPVASIIDSQQLSTRWTTDLGIPFNDWKSDFAVIARMDDTTTGVPVLIEAGLGNTGTLAASELITSGAISLDLENEASCRGKRNFEAVVETQIIDTKPGPPHMLRLICW
jgi:hypothetical protein